MVTIVEPKAYVQKLWNKQEIKTGSSYRMMKYSLRVDLDKGSLLHNVVTGQLVLLSKDERQVLGNLPAKYSPVMDSLIEDHYLVPVDSDEHHHVQNLRWILRRLDDAQKEKHISHYTILPTTACNARCYYCFEQGQRTVTMTAKTAVDVIRFIASNCCNRWFSTKP